MPHVHYLLRIRANLWGMASESPTLRQCALNSCRLAGWRGLYCELSDRRPSRWDVTILQHDDVIAVLRRQIHPRHGTRVNGALNEMLCQ